VSTPAHRPADTVTAVLLQITQHAERLAALDEREASHYREIASRLAELAGQLAKTSGRADAAHATAAREAAILDSLDGLDQQVAALVTQLTGMAATSNGDGGQDGEVGQPARAPRWWKLHGEQREEALGILRAWVEQVYRPGYGHLASALGPCWEQHPLCLYGLDWLMELWSALYLAPSRAAPILASQAEWQTRLLPALAEQMHIETTRCQHVNAASARRRPAAAIPAAGNDGLHPGYPGRDVTP
jgi:hypothetical protein